jgi:hypothetical protein
MNPEPMITDGEKRGHNAAGSLDKAVFMGSGLGPAGRPE